MKKTKCVPDTFQQIQSVDLKSDQQFVLLPPLYYTFFLLGDTVACHNEHGTVYVSINAHLFIILMLTSAQKNTLLFD